MPYDVKLGNATASIVGEINDSNSTSLKYTVGKSMADPAVGCAKEFAASYYCGKKAKNIELTAEAYGKAAIFDCTEEAKSCQDFKLTLGNNCNLQLTDAGGKMLWQSNTTFANSVPNADIVAKGKNRRNYLKSGESLEKGEILSSTSGNCYLEVQKDGNLCVKANVYKCDRGKGGGMVGQSDAYALYSVQSEKAEHVGKLGNVSIDGVISEYPENMTKYINSYTSVGNYDSMGNDIKMVNVTNEPKVGLEECKNLCNQNPECGGFMLGNNQNCYMKNKNMYPVGERQAAKSDYQLYTRNKGVKDNNLSCAKKVRNVDSGYFGRFPSSGKEMTMDTLCGLGVISEQQRKEMDKSQSTLQNIVDTLQQKYQSLTSENKNINNAMKKEINQMDSDFNEFNNLKKESQEINDKSPSLYGMESDTNLEMVSNNYKYILWSILAITAVTLSMKYMR